MQLELRGKYHDNSPSFSSLRLGPLAMTGMFLFSNSLPSVGPVSLLFRFLMDTSVCFSLHRPAYASLLRLCLGVLSSGWTSFCLRLIRGLQ